MICSGIAFYLDPSDSSVLCAASPSSVGTDQRLNLVVEEVKAILPVFLGENPKARSLVRGRVVSVRLIHSYEADPALYMRERQLEFGELERAIQSTAL